MALPLPPGLTPAETAFVCEMEMVTVIPRQRLEGLELLGVRHSPFSCRSASESLIYFSRLYSDRESLN